MNWLAAPMGSQEFLLMNYGLKDTHWTPDAKNNPILNERGKQEATVPFKYITQGPVALYYTKDPNYAQIMQDAEKAMFPFMSVNPTDGYYSPSYASKYPALQRDLSDKINDIVVGRPAVQPDQAAKDWLDGAPAARCAPSTSRISRRVARVKTICVSGEPDAGEDQH